MSSVGARRLVGFESAPPHDEKVTDACRDRQQVELLDVPSALPADAIGSRTVAATPDA
jgi:hypothetical protein